MWFYITLHNSDGSSKNVSELYKIATVKMTDVDFVKQIKRHQTIPLEDSVYDLVIHNSSNLKVNIYSNLEESFPLSMAYDPSPLNKNLGILFSTFVLLGMYILIIWELVHRTFAAMIASTLAIGEIFNGILR